MATALREKLDIEQLEWTPEEELQLFLAMEGTRPVGINKHFYMACIVERLSKSLQREIGSESVWYHLRTMYNLKALDELESVALLNDESDFCLPESDFSILIAKRRQEDAERNVALAINEQDLRKQDAKMEASIVKPVSKIVVPARDVKDLEKDETKDRDSGPIKIKAKTIDNVCGNDGGPKRAQKRTRGSMSNDPIHSNNTSPANTPPNGPNTKRRRI
ncbi:MRG/MORF4L-binding protein [Anopheles nili]|uniref:MRG/MORF4L-binding protein n=1 Tax=Anopheles nili TaxID=185578 RepID=UPI00237B17C7|nr:MRG/MORF4L-binding protein [Anopheles nili]